MKQLSGQELQRPSAFWEPHASARALPVEKGQLGLPPEFQDADTCSIFMRCPYWGYCVSASGAGFPVVGTYVAGSSEYWNESEGQSSCWSVACLFLPRFTGPSSCLGSWRHKLPLPPNPSPFSPFYFAMSFAPFQFLWIIISRDLWFFYHSGPYYKIPDNLWPSSRVCVPGILPAVLTDLINSSSDTSSAGRSRFGGLLSLFSGSQC